MTLNGNGPYFALFHLRSNFQRITASARIKVTRYQKSASTVAYMGHAYSEIL